MKKNVFIIIGLVIIDQLIKLIAFNTIRNSEESIVIIKNILQFTYFQNSGGAFGIFNIRILLIGLDLMIIFLIIKLLLNKKNELDKNAKLGFVLILAGGIGNLIDRIFRGFVIDYMDVTQIFNFPIFNFADMCIVTGVILIAIIIIINTVKSQENSVNEKV